MSARRAVPALLAALAVVVAALVALAPAGPGTAAPARPAGPSGIPRTYDAALAHFSHASGRIRHDKRFVTPSGNIYCAVRVRGIPTGCEISEGRASDPGTCAQAPIKSVGRVEFHHGRAVAICNTDTIRTPGAPTLEYGDIAHIAGTHYACLSETIGVTCINEDKTEGFFLHRGEYVIFNAG